MENESLDPSVRFVRWIKANDSNSSARRRAYVKQASRRTLGLLTSRGDISESFIDEDSVQSQQKVWHCLEDAHGIELCAVDSEATGYEEMTGFEGKAWSCIKSERHHSELLCTP